MAMLSFGGIDVSKDRLDVMVLPEEQCSSVSNDAAGWAKLVEQLRGSSIAAIGIEASGGYERGVMRALLAAGVPVRHVNPFKLRQFARASGVLAKNDPLDARMIASFVTIMPTRPAQRQTPAAERLAEMLAIRRQLSAEKVAAENASRLLEDAMLQRLSRRRIVRLAADIDLLDKRMVEIVATDDALVHRYRLLTSMPGVGAVLACTLIALLPELGRIALSTGFQLLALAHSITSRQGEESSHATQLTKIGRQPSFTRAHHRAIILHHNKMGGNHACNLGWIHVACSHAGARRRQVRRQQR
jgi:transposase